MAIDLINSGKRFLENASGWQSVASAATSRIIASEHKIKPMKEPQHAYRWEFLMSGIFGIKDEIQFYAKRAAIPPVTHETIRKRYAGKEYTFSGRDSSPRVVTVQFWDNQDLEIYRFFSKWMNHMNNYHLNSKVNPINYQKRVMLRLKDTTDGIITEEFSFLDCYPHEIGEVSLDYSSSSEVSFDVTFVFGDMQIGYGIGDIAGDVSSIVTGARNIITSTPGQQLINKAASTVRSLF